MLFFYVVVGVVIVPTSATVTLESIDLVPNRVGAKSTAAFKFTTDEIIPKGDEIIVTLTGKTSPHAFTATLGEVTLGNPAIFSDDIDWLGTSASITGISQSSQVTTITIKLGADTGAPVTTATVGKCDGETVVCGVYINIVGIINPKTVENDHSATVEHNSVIGSKTTLETTAITFSESTLALTPTEYETATTATFTFTASNHDIIVGDVLSLQLPKFTGKPKTISKCSKSPGSMLEGRAESLMWRITLNAASTDGRDLYTCDGNQICELYLTAINNGLPRDTRCSIKITGLTTPAISLIESADVCFHSTSTDTNCDDIYNYKYTTNAIAASTVADIASWTPIVNTDDATITGPGKMLFTEMFFSSYIPSGSAIDIYFTFVYNQILTNGQEEIELYFKADSVKGGTDNNDVVIVVVDKLDKTCGDTTFTSSKIAEETNYHMLTLSIAGSPILAGTLCKLKISTGIILSTTNLAAPLITEDNYLSYGVKVTSTVNSGRTMAKLPIYEFPAISGGMFVESSLKFDGLDIYYTFIYNQELKVDDDEKIELEIEGIIDGILSIDDDDQIGCGATQFRVSGSFDSKVILKIKSTSVKLNAGTRCTIKITGGILAVPPVDVAANSLLHTQQVSTGNIARNTPKIPIPKSNAIWAASAPSLYVARKDCKYFDSATNCDHGKLSTIEDILVNSVTQSTKIRCNQQAGTNFYYEGLTTSSNGRGFGAILKLWSHSDGEASDTKEFSDTPASKITVTNPGNGYRPGDLLIISADQLPGSLTDLILTLQAEDIDTPDHCQSCDGKTAFGYSVVTNHGTSCTSSPQTLCDPLFKTSTSVDLYIKPKGYDGDIHCGIYKAKSSAPADNPPTTLIQRTSFDFGALEESPNSLLPSLTKQVNWIDVTTSGQLINGTDFFNDVTKGSTTDEDDDVNTETVNIDHDPYPESVTYGTGSKWSLYFNANTLEQVILVSPGYGYRPGDKILLSTGVTASVTVLLQKRHFVSEGLQAVGTTSSGDGTGATINLIAGGSLIGGGVTNIDMIVTGNTGQSGHVSGETRNGVSHLPGFGYGGIGGTRGSGATFDLVSGTNTIAGITVVSGGSGYQVGDILVISKSSIKLSIGEDSAKDVVLRVNPSNIVFQSGQITGATITSGSSDSNYKTGDKLIVDLTTLPLGSYNGQLEFTLREDDIEKELMLVSKNKVTVSKSDIAKDVVVHIDSLTPDTMYDAYCHFGDILVAPNAYTLASITKFWTETNPTVWGDSIRVSSITKNADPGTFTFTFMHGGRISAFGEIKLIPNKILFGANTKCSITDQTGGNTAVITTLLPNSYEYIAFLVGGSGSTVSVSSGKQFIISCTNLALNQNSNIEITYGLEVEGHKPLYGRKGYTTSL